MEVRVNEQPDFTELKRVFIESFNDLDPEDHKNFTEETSQSFDEWFSMEEMQKYSKNYGKVIEARDSNNMLVGAAFVGMENPITWPDGNKAEVFIIGVLKPYRRKGIAKDLLTKCDEVAINMGAKMILLNTNTVMGNTQKFYEKIGYKQMGVLTNYYGNGDAVFFTRN